MDLTTGYVNPDTLLWNSSFQNSGLLAIGNANPNLAPPVVGFPGARGFAWAKFIQRPDGLLDFYFHGSTFLPFGNDINGELVRFPLPYCNPLAQCVSVLARGTSLHPHLQLDTRAIARLTPHALRIVRTFPSTRLKSLPSTQDTARMGMTSTFAYRSWAALARGGPNCRAAS